MFCSIPVLVKLLSQEGGLIEELCREPVRITTLQHAVGTAKHGIAYR